VPAAQANLIGAEFQDPHAAPQAPMHEQLITKLNAAGIYSTKGPEHMRTTVSLAYCRCLHAC
jgi:hypothetical protein